MRGSRSWFAILVCEPDTADSQFAAPDADGVRQRTSLRMRTKRLDID